MFASWFNKSLITVVHHTGRIKKTPIIISINTKDTAFDKNQHIIIIKNTLSKLGIQASFFKLIKNIYKTKETNKNANHNNKKSNS
jgi:hypothetical protein